MSNSELFEQAKRYIPGGVDSPVRAFGKVGGTPRFIAAAEGPYLIDAEGKRYIDHVLSWGPMILGHADARVQAALEEQLPKGLSYGAPTELETLMAAEVCGAIDSIERVRFVNSGTEATMSAIRLARAYTGRDLVIKFEGCYHGHVDSLLVKAGSGILTHGVPDTSGVPESIAGTSLVLDYNDMAAFSEAMQEHGERIAAVIVEPIAGNMGMVPPAEGFLQLLRAETSKAGALLIFDEVITGFRFCFGGYQDIVGITPDLTCLGKIIGGGMPVGAFGGRAEIMEMLAPMGPVYQAGTLAGNPMAMAAGLATLNALKNDDPYPAMADAMQKFVAGIEEAAEAKGIAISINSFGSMAGLFFNDQPVAGFDDVMASDAETYCRFFHLMLDRGVYLAPSPFESLFISAAHTPEVMAQSLAAAQEAIAAL